MRRDVFIRTANVTEYRQKVGYVEDIENGEPGFVLVWGQAGRGKTETTRHYHAENGGIFYRVMQGLTQAAFLQGLCFEITGLRPRAVSASKAAIIEHLDVNNTTIFVDEADRLHVDRIEDLRDIHDETGTPVVLIGEQELNGLLATRRRIWSRVKQVVEFGPVSEEDVGILASDAAELVLGPEACARIVTHSGGDWRLVWSLLGHLERATKAKEIDHVDATLVAEVAKHVVSWRVR